MRQQIQDSSHIFIDSNKSPHHTFLLLSGGEQCRGQLLEVAEPLQRLLRLLDELRVLLEVPDGLLPPDDVLPPEEGVADPLPQEALPERGARLVQRREEVEPAGLLRHLGILSGETSKCPEKACSKFSDSRNLGP